MKHVKATWCARGFTLVEVLIAMTLSATLIVLLFSAMHTYSKTATAGHEEVRRKYEKEAAFDFIKGQLREIVPLATASPARALFFADETRISYVGWIPAHRAPGGLHRNLIEISGSPPDLALTFSYAPLSPDDGFDDQQNSDRSPATSRRLLGGFASITFEYREESEGKGETSWQREWTRTDRLPGAIRIRTKDGPATPEDSYSIRVFANSITRRKAMTLGRANARANVFDDVVSGAAPDRPSRELSAGQPR